MITKSEKRMIENYNIPNQENTDNNILPSQIYSWSIVDIFRLTWKSLWTSRSWRIWRWEYILSLILIWFIKFIVLLWSVWIVTVIHDTEKAYFWWMVLSWIKVLLDLVLWIITLGQTIKRAHDIEKSAFWLLWLLIPLYNFYILIKLLFEEWSPGINGSWSNPLRYQSPWDWWYVVLGLIMIIWGFIPAWILFSQLSNTSKQWSEQAKNIFKQILVCSTIKDTNKKKKCLLELVSEDLKKDCADKKWTWEIDLEALTATCVIK